MEEKDEVSRHICSQAQQTTVHPEKGTGQVPVLHWNMLAHIPVPAPSPIQQHPCCCFFTFGSLLKQAATLQFSLQVTHTSQTDQGSTLLFHFMFHFLKMKHEVLGSFPPSQCKKYMMYFSQFM